MLFAIESDIASSLERFTHEKFHLQVENVSISSTLNIYLQQYLQNV